MTLPKTQPWANYVLNSCPLITKFYKLKKRRLTGLPTSRPKALQDSAFLDRERREIILENISGLDVALLSIHSIPLPCSFAGVLKYT